MNKLVTFIGGVVVGVVYKDSIMQLVNEIKKRSDAELDERIEKEVSDRFKGLDHYEKNLFQDGFDEKLGKIKGAYDEGDD